MTDRIRAVIDDQARLPVKSDMLSDFANLYDAGMTSLSSVSVMLRLEEEFCIEFPDRMLRREVFESVASIHEALKMIIAGDT